MQQVPSTTSSNGQSKSNKAAANSTISGNLEKPIYDFGQFLAVGAGQIVPPSASISPSPFPSGPAPVNPEIPRGAILPSTFEPTLSGRGTTLTTRQLWEGTVTEIRDGEFVATLSDRSNPASPDEQAVFDGSEISPEDQKLISPGSSFYWIIGNEVTAGGQLKNVSIVQFRRLPIWTNRALAKAADRANRVSKLFLNGAEEKE